MDETSSLPAPPGNPGPYGPTFIPPRSRRRLPPSVNALCLAVTVVTMSIAGAWFAAQNGAGPGFRKILLTPALWLTGWPYALCVVLILGSHEMGHYIACRHYRVDATLPFFLPSPFLFGTFGAVIRIRAPIRDRKALFDIGVAGPIAGFVVAVPVLFLALTLSSVVHAPPPADFWELPGGLLMDAFMRRFAPALLDPRTTPLFHPTYRAAWLGLFATGLNLLPIGQLDGGHILYAISGRLHAAVSRLGIPLLIGIGVWRGAYHLITFAVLFAVIGPRHPPLLDERERLGPGRVAVAWVALAIFLLTIVVNGIRAT